MDHLKFDARVEKLPYVGEALVCGFCFPLWVTLLSILIPNPLAGWSVFTDANSFPILQSATRVILGWFSTGFAVLFMRFCVVALMDGSAILSHGHHASHEKEK